MLPPPAVVDAYLAPVSHLTRRVEIYENDAVTPWKPDLWDSLLVEGSVGVDYSRDERRSVDLTLDNYDGELDHTPSNLWYDKIFKVYSGIMVNQSARQPVVAIIEEYNAPGQALALKNLMNSAGITRVRINATTTQLIEVLDADIIVSISSTFSQKLSLLHAAFDAGKSVFTFNPQSTAAQLPRLISTAAGSLAASATITANPVLANAHPIQVGWNVDPAWSVPTTQIRQITGVVNAATVVGQIKSGATTSSGIIAYSSPSVANWVHVQMGKFSDIIDTDDTEFKAFLAASVSWLDTYEPIDHWEVQIGEFLADDISNDETGDLIIISGRDMTKRCIQSKVVNATAFATGTNIVTIIKALASNSGITKFNIEPFTTTLPIDVTYERGTERWKIMKEIADTNGYELFFDQYGYLTMRKYQDPLLTPASFFLTSGVAGNLVNETNKANDQNLFNHIVVVGEGPDSRVVPVAAEAKNITASSPSSIQKIGDRVKEIKSNLITTQAQAQTMANQMLAVSSLEEFSLDFSAIMFPWLEVGEILEIEQQRVGTWYPTRYLITSLDMPLDLSPMSGSAKRVSIVL